MPRRPRGEDGGSLIDLQEAKHRNMEAYREALEAKIRSTEQEFSQWLSDVFGEYTNRPPGITARAHAFHDLNSQEFEQAAREGHYPVVVEITISNSKQGIERMTRKIFVRVDKKQFFVDLEKEWEDSKAQDMFHVVVGVLEKERKIARSIESKRIEQQEKELRNARDYVVRELQGKGCEDVSSEVADSIAEKGRNYYQSPPNPPFLLEDAPYAYRFDRPLHDNPDASYVAFYYDSLFGSAAAREFDEVPFSDSVAIGNDYDQNRKLWADSCARTEVFHEAWIRK